MSVTIVIAIVILISLIIAKGIAFYKMGEAWIDYTMSEEGSEDDYDY